MLVTFGVAMVLMVDKYEYGPICLYMVRLSLSPLPLSLSFSPSLSKASRILTLTHTLPPTHIPKVALPVWLLGAYRLVLQTCFAWDVRVFMGHLAIPLGATSLTGTLQYNLMRVQQHTVCCWTSMN